MTSASDIRFAESTLSERVRDFGYGLCCLVAAFVIYMLSFRPVLGIANRNGTLPRWVQVIYKPAVDVWASMPRRLESTYEGYLEWSIRLVRRM
jgi:hypothetical protein